MNTKLAVSLMIVAAALSGCTADENVTILTIVSPAEDLEIDGAIVSSDSIQTYDLPFNPSARASSPYYDEHGIVHPDGYTVFDQLVDAESAGFVTFDVHYFADFSSFLLTTLNDVELAENEYWALAINGADSPVGMGDAQLASGDVVTWSVASFEPAGEAVGIAIEGESVTMNNTVEVTVTPDQAGLVTLTLHSGNQTELIVEQEMEGPQLFAVAVPHGDSAIIALLDTGSGTGTAVHNVTRLVDATVQIRFNSYPGAEDREDTIWYNPSNHASADMYVDVDASHPGYATVHDVFVEWEAQTEAVVTYSYSDDFAYGIEQIDGAGNPVAAAAPPWWCYTINDEPVEFGITLQAMAPGDTMMWDLGDCGFVPA